MTQIQPYDEALHDHIGREEWARRMDAIREYEAAEAALEAGTASVEQVILMLGSAAGCCEGEGFNAEAQACERAILLIRQRYG